MKTNLYTGSNKGQARLHPPTASADAGGSDCGQALVMLLVLMVVAITVTSAAVIVILVNSLSAGRLASGTSALDVAESGAENALLRLLRDPNYGGETLPVGSGTALATVSGASNKTITSQGSLGNFVRKVRIDVTYNNNVLTILSWKEVSP